MARLQANLLAALCLLLAASARPAIALTYANQTAALLAFKASMLPLGPNWAAALQVKSKWEPAAAASCRCSFRLLTQCHCWFPCFQTWNCPTPNSSNPDGSCDPCGTKSWWAAAADCMPATTAAAPCVAMPVPVA